MDVALVGEPYGFYPSENSVHAFKERVMKSAKNILHVSRSVFLVAALVLGLGGVCTHVAQARSLYVIGSITNFGNPLPIMAYDIAPDGSLTFQRQQTIPFRDGGAVGIAVDWQSEYLFVTFEYSDTISLLDARTLAEVGKVSAANAENLAGVVYDQSKELLYCVDRDTNKLFSYQWQPSAG
jgi:6-phosphogluconolactonase (cycloisomerase 2 family)